MSKATKAEHTQEEDWLDQITRERAETDEEYREKFYPEFKLISALLRARAAAGLTQREVAVASGLTQPQVAKVEKTPASINIKTLTSYLAAVGVEIKLVRRSRPAKGKSKPIRAKGKRAAVQPKP